MIFKNWPVLGLAIILLSGCQHKQSATKTVAEKLFDDNLKECSLGHDSWVPPEKVIFSQLEGDQGSTKPTGRNWDLGLSGQGFFLLKDENNKIYFTRNGNFGIGEDLCVIHRPSGFKVQEVSEDKVTLKNICMSGKSTKKNYLPSRRDTILTNYNIDRDGTICGIYGDGTISTLGRFGIALLQFSPKAYDLKKHLLVRSDKGGEVFYSDGVTQIGPTIFPQHLEEMDAEYYKKLVQ